MKAALFIYGPTAVGKTDFANQLATRLPCEIINLDVGQLYTPLTIGTAKPAWNKAATPHHMFDVCSQPVDFSVTEYRNVVQSLIEQIVKRGNIPVFVGGSGFYMHSLLFPPISYSPVSMRESTTTDNDSSLWEQLNSIDAVRAAAIHPHDTYRLRRALTLYQHTNMRPSHFEPIYSPIIAPFFIFLTHHTDILKQRITQRVEFMFEDGWIHEVKSLVGTPWESFLLRKKLIGYPELVAYCRAGEPRADLSRLKEIISRSTWHYARKQLSYARMFSKKIRIHDANAPFILADLTSQPLELYIEQLARTILSS